MNIHEGSPIPSESLQLDTLRALLQDENKTKNLQQKIKSLEQGQFKDSKCTDGNGELEIVWHGSPRIFDQFDVHAKGEWRWRNQGIHFFSKKEGVVQYANKAIESLFLVIDGIGKQEVGKEYDPSNEMHFQRAAHTYNEVISDLIENGEKSQYFEKKEDFARLVYKQDGMDYEWAGEIFGGRLPTKESVKFVKGPNGTDLYLGRDIGRVYYAVVLNITNPFMKETRVWDTSFKQGEESYRNGLSDGTILIHRAALIGQWGPITGTAGTKSYAVFDPEQIRIVGREINDEFELTPEFSDENYSNPL